MYVVRIQGYATGSPCPVAGMYVRDFDFEKHDGAGEADVTEERDNARAFETVEALYAWWRTAPECKPVIDDRPNRPFMVYSITVIDLERANVREGGSGLGI